MIKIPKEMLIEKIKEKGLTDAQIKSKVKDKLDQLSGLISEEGALHIIANELGVKVMDEGKLKLKNVLAGMRSVDITAKILKIYEIREFSKGDKKGKVGNFLIGDETGIMRVVAWNDKADFLSTLKEGVTIKIESGYTKENQGKTEIHLGDKSTVTLSDEAISVQTKGNERKNISDLKENDDNIEIMGTIVQVFDPRFWPVDPLSGKKATEKDGEFFFEDKKITPDYSYVTNIFLDDGTENIRVVLWKNQAQKLFDMNHLDIVASKDLGFEEKKNDLLGKIVKFTGKTNKNQMFDRIEFIAQIVDTNPNPQEEMERLKAIEAKEEKTEMSESKPKEKAQKKEQKKETPSGELHIEDIEGLEDLE